MKLRLITTVLFSAFLLTACGLLPNSAKISSTELNNAITNGATTMKILDVRQSEDFDGGHIQGSISLPYDNEHFDQMYQRLDWPTNTVIVVVDSYEFRALDASKKLQSSGFTEVKTLEGGFEGWKTQNYQIVK